MSYEAKSGYTLTNAGVLEERVSGLCEISMHTFMHLVHTDHGGNGGDLGLVEGLVNDWAVVELDLVVGGDPGEGVLAPVVGLHLLALQRLGVVVLVHSARVILAGVCATALLACLSRVDGLLGVGHQVLQLQGLDKVSVPHNTTVLDAEVLHVSDALVQLDATLLEGGAITEHGSVVLHGALHLEAEIGSGRMAGGVAHVVEVSNGGLSGAGGQRGVGGTGLVGGSNGVGACTAEHNDVQKRVGTKTVGTVHGGGGTLAGGVQTRDNNVLTVLVGDNLAEIVSGDTAHVVVHGGQHGDGLLGHINTGKDGGRLGDTGQTLVEDLSGQMVKLQVHVVLHGTDTAALTDFDGGGTGHDVTGGQILGAGSIALHVALALRVEQVATLTTAALSDQAAGTVDASGVELYELEILKGETGTGNHGVTVTSAGVSRGAREVSTAIAAGGQDHVVGPETVDGAILHVHGNHTTAGTILHDQVHGKVLDEVVGALVAQRLAVQGVQDGVACAISHGTAAVCLASLAELE
eukprot:comp19618_c0_seq1/m.23132 comp19618_c0_seq1/g.23132  ORF comp19618_c0_seq1/g.23132 comp19618_c0_seq1/m.23132 type:complete len:521 (+) comp19618_c0_seq1:701-2263(+)